MKFLVLSKCTNAHVWHYVYSEAPKLLSSRPSVKAWGDIMVPVTKCMLDLACDQPSSSQNADKNSEINLNSASRLSLHSSNKLVKSQNDSFQIAELSSELEDYSTDFMAIF